MCKQPIKIHIKKQPIFGSLLDQTFQQIFGNPYQFFLSSPNFPNPCRQILLKKYNIIIFGWDSFFLIGLKNAPQICAELSAAQRPLVKLRPLSMLSSMRCTAVHGNARCYTPQCPRTDLNKRFLPRPKTTTA